MRHCSHFFSISIFLLIGLLPRVAYSAPCEKLVLPKEMAPLIEAKAFAKAEALAQQRLTNSASLQNHLLNAYVYWRKAGRFIIKVSAAGRPPIEMIDADLEKTFPAASYQANLLAPAEPHLVRVIQLSPRCLDYHLDLINFYQATQKEAEFLRAIQKTAETVPGDATVVALRTYATKPYQQGNYSVAQKIYETIIAARPNDEKAIANLSSVFAQQGKFPEAQQMAERALRLDRKDNVASSTLLTAMQLGNDFEKAEKFLWEKLKSTPDDMDAWAELAFLDLRHDKSWNMKLLEKGIANSKASNVAAWKQKLDYFNAALQEAASKPELLYVLASNITDTEDAIYACGLISRLERLFPNSVDNDLLRAKIYDRFKIQPLHVAMLQKAYEKRSQMTEKNLFGKEVVYLNLTRAYIQHSKGAEALNVIREVPSELRKADWYRFWHPRALAEAGDFAKATAAYKVCLQEKSSAETKKFCQEGLDAISPKVKAR